MRGALVGAAILSSWLVPAILAAPVASIQRDVPFGEDPAQKLDLFTPDSKGFPTVIFVHGGSLTSGDKADSDYGKVCDAFPAAGIACANVNYRLMPGGAGASGGGRLGAVAHRRERRRSQATLPARP